MVALEVDTEPEHALEVQHLYDLGDETDVDVEFHVAEKVGRDGDARSIRSRLELGQVTGGVVDALGPEEWAPSWSVSTIRTRNWLTDRKNSYSTAIAYLLVRPG